MKNPTIIHIAVEIFCLLLIFMYIRRNTRRLQNQIDDLTRIIQEQQEIIHLHQKQLSRFVQAPQFLANVSTPSPNVVQIPAPSHGFDTNTTYFTVPYTESDSGHEMIKENEGQVTTIVSTTSSESLDEELKDEIKELAIEEQRHSNTEDDKKSDQPHQETVPLEKVDVLIEDAPQIVDARSAPPSSPKNTELFENLPS
jgi:hypothetical protein